MNRIWMAAGALGIGVLYWAVGQAVSPSSGDTELKAMLEASKKVKTFRGAYSAPGTEQNLWEVDCNRVIVHQHAQIGVDSAFGKLDQLLVGEQGYSRNGSEGWENNGPVGPRGSAQWYCDNIARGTVRDLLPDMFTMIGHAMMEKMDKKTVSGVRCQDWNYAIQSTTSPQKGSICIGLDDHLPYELISQSGRYTYSDYNKPIQFDAPDAVLQSASASETSN